VLCLVTGASGFIGSNLCDLLLNRGHEVVGLDDFSIGRLSNLQYALKSNRFRLIECDITETEQLPNLSGVDYVFHLAALADIVPSIENPKRYVEVNVQGTANILEYARSLGANRFIYTASSSCYGIPSTYPTDEKQLIDTRYPYALSKYLGELTVFHWSQVYEFPVMSLRLFNVYGPRARTSGTYGAVLGVFLSQKLHGKPLTIVGDGDQTRDFTHVSDVCTALLAAAECEHTGIAVNIGSGGTYSIKQLARLIGGDIVHIPKRPGEPDVTFADIRLARELLKWSPKVTFEEGIKNLLDNIDLWSDAPVWTKDTIESATKMWFKYL